jgi:hypothetical protein
MRVSRGGHDVLSEKLVSGFRARLPIWTQQFRLSRRFSFSTTKTLLLLSVKWPSFKNGESVFLAALVPQWLHALR